MKFCNVTILSFAAVSQLLCTDASSKVQTDSVMANLDATLECAQKISQNVTTRSLTSQTQEQTFGTLLNFFTLVGYVKTMVDATQKYDALHKIETTLQCENCHKEVSASVFFNSLTALALGDLADGKNTYNQMKSILDGSLQLLANGSAEEITSFMTQVAKDIGFPCPHCKEPLRKS
ncbi:MAG: hypothetical protein WC365_03915 [Candidatus Babeliales bacterium]|jgi:hypothetical protein